jgi:chemotaxis protein MotB
MFMVRRRRQEQHDNHERWLVSYADLLTLMFAFFVVMYAMSSVNEGKFRVLASSLVASFRAPTRSLEPIQMGEPVKSPIAVPPINLPTHGLSDVPHKLAMVPAAENARLQNGYAAADPSTADLDFAALQIRAAMAPLIEQGLVNVRHMTYWLEVEIKASILFASGSATLESGALPVLERLALILRGLENPIEVEGFTDNVPISNAVFPSNWELSAARAASVVRLFVDQGVPPKRMAVVGFGEFRPIAENTSEQGRRRNRRVIVSVLMKDRTRHDAIPPSCAQTLKESTNERVFKASPSETGVVPGRLPVEAMVVSAER